MNGLPLELTDEQLERDVLGSILFMPHLFDLLDKDNAAEAFYFLKHRWIWQAWQSLREEGIPVDYATTLARLKERGQLDDLGGAAYITLLLNSPGSATESIANGLWGLLRRLQARRALYVQADKMRAEILNFETADTADILQRFYDGIEAAAELLEDDWATTQREAVMAFMDRADERLTNQQTGAGLKFGYKQLDAAIGGLAVDDLMLLAGRATMGKTTAALNIAYNIAKAGGAVYIMSLEMGVEQLLAKEYGMESGLDTRTVRAGVMTPDLHSKLMAISGELAGLNIVYDRPRKPQTVRSFRRAVKRAQRQIGRKFDLIILDGVWLLAHGKEARGLREDQVVEADVTFLKQFAVENQTPIIALHQLNRAPDARDDKRPILSDLRAAGEQSPDVVVFVYRDNYYKVKTGNIAEFEWIVAKNRNGANNIVIPAMYDMSSQRISDPPQRQVQAKMDLSKKKGIEK